MTIAARHCMIVTNYARRRLDVPLTHDRKGKAIEGFMKLFISGKITVEQLNQEK